MASRGKGAKNKGSSFERKIAKEFGIKLFNNPEALKRTPLSGGGVWKGDIQLSPEVDLPPSAFPYCIECKNEENWTLETLFREVSKSVVFSWWQQVIKSCPASKIPIVVMTRNFYPVFVMYKESKTLPIMRNVNCVLLWKDNETFVIVTLTDFLKEFNND
jgi:hypothetical protein